MSTATKSLDRLSESRLVLSEDWLSVGIGLAVFLLALAGLSGTDFLGWVVTTSVWTDPAKALAPASKLYAALGGTGNIERVDDCAETRLRVIVHDMAGVDDNSLTNAGIDAVVRLPNNTIHLLAGLNADQYAAEMRGQLALPLAA